MATQPDIIETCLDGRHRPLARYRRVEGDVIRSVCRDCGCSLMRTLATRRWYQTGQLG